MRQGVKKKAQLDRWRIKKALDRAIAVPFEFTDLRSSYTTQYERKVYLHEELEKLGISTVKWDGLDAIPIQTKSGLLVALLTGRPSSPSWEEKMRALANAVDSTRAKMSFNKDQVDHQRGKCPTIGTGVSYGSGATGSGSKHNTRAVLELRKTPELAQLSGFVNKAFQNYAPILSTFCKLILTRFETKNPTLRRPFPDSAFGTMSFNFGPDVCTFPHKDFKNLSWGWCVVTSFGDYDHTKGGRLTKPGIKRVSLGPGLVDGIHQVVNIAASNPHFPVILHWTGRHTGDHFHVKAFIDPSFPSILPSTNTMTFWLAHGVRRRWIGLSTYEEP
ncbi:hypothetical protein BDM02DRAFT_3132535 [Thelephora ganbajun]|uniref:Uncharacterized protein n=1 Tax=Thelephora ganbajun TaxID=370292 RepID=A0ACB6Z1Z1_THEGA|nr:hypothetical protein BDM02DRAFT_3132535 [Thelephora ganbajun]